MEHWARRFFEKITLKHLQNTFGHFWERFWAFLEFWKFLDFFEYFRRHDPPWNTGRIFFFRKNHPKATSKHVWTLLGTILGMFGFLNFFLILKIFVWTLLGTILGIFELWNFFDFFENFRRLDPPWNTGQKIFRKNYPKTSSKHVWTLLGTILGIFGILKIFGFFWKFSKNRPSMEHWAKIFSKKSP